MTMVNPWLDLDEDAGAGLEEPGQAGLEEPGPRVRSWLPVAEVPEVDDGLPLVEVAEGRVWVVGAHGGAGTSTVALVSGVAEAGTGWPVPAKGVSRVWIVARTNHAGMRAAQSAAVQWAGGGVPGVDLAGVVWVADAPGRLPRVLREDKALISGAFPSSLMVPWVGAWRESGVQTSSIPKRALRILSAIQ